MEMRNRYLIYQGLRQKNYIKEETDAEIYQLPFLSDGYFLFFCIKNIETTF
jgi:hypothetical protein